MLLLLLLFMKFRHAAIDKTNARYADSCRLFFCIIETFEFVLKIKYDVHSRFWALIYDQTKTKKWISVRDSLAVAYSHE